LQGFWATEELKFHKKSIVYAQRTPWKKYKKVKKGQKKEIITVEELQSTGKIRLISAKKSREKKNVVGAGKSEKSKKTKRT
jgi:hypothetical protein